MSISPKAKTAITLSFALIALIGIVFACVQWALGDKEDKAVNESYKYLAQPTKSLRVLPEGDPTADFIYRKGWWVAQGFVKDESIKHLVSTAKDLKNIRIVLGEFTANGISLFKSRDVKHLCLIRTDLNAACMKAISELSSLTILEFQECLDSGMLCELTGPKRVTTLILKKTEATNEDIQSIVKTFPGLEFLDLTGSRKIDDGAIKYLKTMPRLHDMYVTGSSLTHAGVVDLVNSIKITGLDISRSAAGDDFVKQIQNSHVERLEINDSPVTDKSLDSLAKLKSLKTLTMVGCFKLSPEAIETFKKCRPQCSFRNKPIAAGLDSVRSLFNSQEISK